MFGFENEDDGEGDYFPNAMAPPHRERDISSQSSGSSKSKTSQLNSDYSSLYGDSLSEPFNQIAVLNNSSEKITTK